MNFKLNYFWKASKQVLTNQKYALLFAALAVLAFIALIFVLVVTIPGNSFEFQLSILTIWELLLMALLSFLIALLFTMHVWIFKRTKKAQVGKSVVGGTSAVTATIFGTAACSSCLAFLFGLVGISSLSTIIFLLDFRWYFVSISIFLMLISIYFASKNIVEECENCEVKK